MFWRRRSDADDQDPRILRLRPPNGFGDHLMLSAVIEGLKAERPELRLRIAANHPELFKGNPHVEEVVYEGSLKKFRRGALDAYLLTAFRPPEERHMQSTGHLIDDMYDRIGIPLVHRPREPRIYLSDRELCYREAEIEALARPRVAVVPNGKPNVRLPNKIYPADQWAELGALLGQAAGSLLQVGASQDGPLLPGAADFRDIGYRHTASLLRRCDLVVTHVSGIMHLATAVGTRAVVLYGAAEHPAISGYPQNLNLYVPIECGPCWLETPCSHLSCMKQLTPRRVLEEVSTALAQSAAA
jgi:ADP-heptose:LPS heptosyltransferase